MTQSNVGAISQVWRYPVKSMGGEQLTTADLDMRGLDSDRLWAVHTPDGKFGSGKNTRRFRKVGGLLDLRARLDGSRPVITLPDGTEVGIGDDNALATALDAPGISLRREGDVSHLDGNAVHLITTAGLRWFQTLLPDAQLGVPRFRPNLVVDADGDERVEEEWKGRELSIGTARLRVAGRTQRCAMTTVEQPGLNYDARILKTLGVETDLLFGIYADVLTPGTVTVGDAVLLS